MYEVYSTQRPGRPGWALVANAALLAATVGMAAGVAHLRQASSNAPLGEVTVLDEVGLQARVPAGWKAQPVVEDSHGALIGFIETAGRTGPGRQLVLFRYLTDPLSLTSESEDTPQVVSRVVRKVGTGVVMMRSEELEAGPVGPYTGTTVLLSPVLQMPGVQVYPASAVGRVALAPSGDLLGAALLLAQAPRPSDLKLFERVCDSLMLGGMAFVEDPAAVMEAAGITFDPPVGVRFMDTRASKNPHLRMTGDRTDSSWFLAAYPVSMEGVSSLDQLIDRALSPEGPEIGIERNGEEFQVGDRKVLRIPLHSRASPGVAAFVAAVRLDSRAALLVAGTSDAAGEGQLEQVFRTVVGKARVQGHDDAKAPRRNRKR